MKITATLYFLIGLTDVYAEYSGNSGLIYITRPLLMVVLILFYLSGMERPVTGRDRLMIGALVFSWIGDMMLVYSHGRELFFLGGLVSFLIAHVCYIAAFTMVADRSAEPVLRNKIWLAIPLAAYLAALLSVVFPAVDAHMKLPIAIYSAVIGTMAIFALNRFKRVNDSSFALVFGGALLFMLSDSLIAVNRFLCHGSLYMGGVWIMSLYISGQYLIAKGMLRNDNLKITYKEDGVPIKQSI